MHLDGPSGFYDDWKDYDPAKIEQRNLAAYLYSGVTSVRSAGDQLDRALETRNIVNTGEKQGAELFVIGPLFTGPGSHDNSLKDLPAPFREASIVPKSADDARQQVSALKKMGVDGIEAVLGGFDVEILHAISAQAHADKLPIVVRTSNDADVHDALRAHVDGVERGYWVREIPGEELDAMQKQGIAFDPMLSLVEGLQGKKDLLNRSLVQQVAPPALFIGTRKFPFTPPAESFAWLDTAKHNLLRAYRHGVPLVAGSGAGSLMVFHGPSIQHELQLWIDAGIPLQVALNAATLNAAKALHAEARLGSVEKGKDATMLIVDGNPLQDIKALESVSLVMFKGERVDRPQLFKPE